MEHCEDRRRYQRYDYSIPMSLYRMDYQDEHYYAEMKDSSQAGLSMLTNEKLVVGQIVYLEMKSHTEHATGPEKCKNFSGEVKWMRTYSSSNGDPTCPYEYGIEYYEPNLQSVLGSGRIREVCTNG